LITGRRASVQSASKSIVSGALSGRGCGTAFFPKGITMKQIGMALTPVTAVRADAVMFSGARPLYLRNHEPDSLRCFMRSRSFTFDSTKASIMPSRITLKTLAAACLFACGTLADAHAAVITTATTFLPGASTGTIGPFGVTPAPNNDDAPGQNPNAFNYNVFFNSTGITDVEFTVADSGGTTEYFVTQTLINNTGKTWTDYTFELGFGTGANFVRSSLSDLLDFDLPNGGPAPFSSKFASLTHGADTLAWTNGSVTAISAVLFSFSIDLPDNLKTFNPAGLNKFTLRQVAAPPAAAPVPEPGSMLLLGGGLLGLAAKLRKRR
jgi:hypothetical protein